MEIKRTAKVDAKVGPGIREAWRKGREEDYGCGKRGKKIMQEVSGSGAGNSLKAKNRNGQNNDLLTYCS